MLKRILASILFSLCLPALAQSPSVPASRLEPHWGFIRKSPCAAGNADLCGSNPPTYPVTPAMCGVAFSTSSARNADGSVSTQGVRFTLPTVAQFTAAGYTPAGATPASGFVNRSGQCQVSFIMGAPEENYLRIGLYGVTGDDKFTPVAQGAYDIQYGEVVFPYRSANIVTYGWNGTSWLLLTAAPAMAELHGMGQLSAHGQGRLFYVSADPTWSTVGSLIGNLAFCPFNGNGHVSNGNGGFQIAQIPYTCAFHPPGTGGPTTEWLVAYNATSGVATGVAAGAAYASGTAPDGTAYAAGNYVVLQQGSFVNFATGNTIEVHNVRMTNGTNLEGKWIGKLIDATHVELHEQITPLGISAPSSFVSGDTWVAGGNSNFMALANEAISSVRETTPSTGVDREGRLHVRTIVGIATKGPTGFSGTYQDTFKQRMVASLYNPMEKKCLTQPTVNRTTTSATFTEINSELRCSFVYLSGVSAMGGSYGDVGRRVRWTVNAQVSNSTSGAGCDVTGSFDATTGGETEMNGFVNPTGLNSIVHSVTVSSSKAVGLSEVVSHYITLLVRTVGGGTCTVYPTTSLNATLWQ